MPVDIYPPWSHTSLILGHVTSAIGTTALNELKANRYVKCYNRYVSRIPEVLGANVSRNSDYLD